MATATRQKVGGNGTEAEPHAGVIKIVEPDYRELNVTIVGRTALLSNAISEHAVRVLQGWKPPKDEMPTPEQQFESSIYRDDQGRCCVPGIAVRLAMIDAGRSAGHHMTVLRQIFSVEAELLPIELPDSPRRREKAGDRGPEMRLDTPRNKKTGGMCLSYRAMYRCPWEVVVPLSYNAEMIGRDDLLALLQIAGRAVGIGCWRVEKNGIFGQFSVGRVEER